jgi:DNA-binding response OmpR family regulator
MGKTPMGALPVILVVDDDAATRELMSELLTVEGYAAESVAAGTTGLARIEQGNVDLVLLDLNLQDIDGLELCRRINNGQRAARLPIIMLSASSGDQWKSASRAAGADDVVAKPFDIDHLLDRLRTHLSDKTAGQG